MPSRLVSDYLRALPAAGLREVADGEWGLTLEAAGGPLHVGLALRRGLLRAQAPVAWPGTLDPAMLLHRNRSLELVRYATTRSGEVWVVGELPEAGIDDAGLDRLLGSLLEAATGARELAVRAG